MNILEIESVKKTFGKETVLKGIDLAVPKGSIFGLIGKNGAGKTTMMKMILGLEELTEGKIRISGEQVSFGNTKTNRLTGYLPDVPEFYGYMSSREYLTLCGEITGIPKEELSSKIEEMLSLVGLKENKKRISSFSRGMKQRLGIAQALLNDPSLLICDEPTSALDPSGRQEFLELLYSLRGKVTIIFSTHILNDVERICDYVGILNGGKIVTHSKLVDLKKQYVIPQIELIVEVKQLRKLKDILEQFEQEKWIQSYHEKNQSFFISYTCEYESLMGKFFDIFQEKKLLPELIRKIEPSLEQIFLEVIK